MPQAPASGVGGRVGLRLGVVVRVDVLVRVRVAVGVALRVGLAVAVGVAVRVGLTVAVGVAVRMGLTVAVGVAVRVAVAGLSAPRAASGTKTNGLPPSTWAAGAAPGPAHRSAAATANAISRHSRPRLAGTAPALT